MYNLSPRLSDTRSEKRLKLIEVCSSGENIPLQQNWLNRKCTLPWTYKQYFEQIYNFEVFDDDVFIVTLPKCGTTWMQETAWLLLNDLNFTKAKYINVTLRSAHLEMCAMNDNSRKNTIEMAAALPRPRLIKTHLPANLIPRQIWQKKTKIIYVARNPKDVVVSFYHFVKGIGRLDCTLDEFVNDFINSNIDYLPYWSHLSDFWHMRDQSQIFFTTYENMKVDLKNVLITLNEFLANAATNPTKAIKNTIKKVSKDFEFMRRGIVGSYRDELSHENQRKLNAWSKKCCEAENLNENEIFRSCAISKL